MDSMFPRIDSPSVDIAGRMDIYIHNLQISAEQNFTSNLHDMCMNCTLADTSNVYLFSRVKDFWCGFD